MKEKSWLDDEVEEKVEEVSTLTLGEVSKWASGVCDKCHERYTAVPVINNKPQCPNCDSV